MTVAGSSVTGSAPHHRPLFGPAKKQMGKQSVTRVQLDIDNGYGDGTFKLFHFPFRITHLMFCLFFPCQLSISSKH